MRLSRSFLFTYVFVKFDLFRLLLFVAGGGVFVRPSAGRLALSGSRRWPAAAAAAAAAAAISAGDNGSSRGGVRKVAGRHRS